MPSREQIASVIKRCDRQAARSELAALTETGSTSDSDRFESGDRG
jgi:hypothetical protein